jgi:hypothetical protein
MRYLKTYESYKNSKVEPVNEEFLGKLFGNLFKKMKDTINKTKGGAEVEAIYQKYMKTIQDEVLKQAKISLEIEAAAKGILDQIKTPTEPKKEGEATEGEATEGEATEGEVKKESLNTKGYQKIFEAEETEKVSADVLKQKKGLIDQIIKKNQELALKEMDAILKKYGGSSASPQLAAIIDSKKMQFEIDVLNSKVKALEGAGDEKSAQEISKEVETKTKEMQTALEQGMNKKALEFKEGEQVVYKRDKFNEEEWKKLTDDDKKKPEEGKMKELQDKEMIGVKKISKVDGDNISFEDADFTKAKGDILMGVGGDKNEEAKKAAESLGKIKDDADKMKVVASLADMLQDDAKKDQVEQIKKIISGE